MIGFRVLVVALESGYSVRAAVRSQAKADIILAAPSIKRFNPGPKLSFVFVPDIVVEGAYDNAVKGVKYIIHIASPFPGADQTSPEALAAFVDVGVQGTTGILRSAAKTTGIKRIVITSSASAIVSLSELAGGTTKIITADNRVPFDEGPYQFPAQAYFASKVKAILAIDDFFANKKTEFDHINIMPGYVLGKDELATTPEAATQGSNRMLMNLVLGRDGRMPAPGVVVLLDDVAKIHVEALDQEKIAGGQNFEAVVNGMENIQWNDYQDIVKRHFPEAVQDGRLPNSGNQTGPLIKVDTQKTEKAFGIKFRGYKEQVVETVGHYLELLDAKKE